MVIWVFPQHPWKALSRCLQLQSWTSSSPWSSYTSPELKAWEQLLSERVFTRGLICSNLFLLFSPSAVLRGGQTSQGTLPGKVTAGHAPWLSLPSTTVSAVPPSGERLVNAGGEIWNQQSSWERESKSVFPLGFAAGFQWPIPKSVCVCLSHLLSYMYLGTQK